MAVNTIETVHRTAGDRKLLWENTTMLPVAIAVDSSLKMSLLHKERYSISAMRLY